jgi:hypothetical protein
MIRYEGRRIIGSSIYRDFIMYSRITKLYSRKTAGHIFTKPVQIGATQKIFSQ